MPSPLSFDPAPLFDPSTVRHIDVTEQAQYVPGQVRGTVILETDRVRQLLFGVPEGQTMPRHRASCDVTVTVVAGTGALTLDEAEPIRLRPGGHLFLPEGTPHAVEAESDLALVATFAAPRPEIRFIGPV